MTAGRPTQYRPDFAEQARRLCGNGATDRELAFTFGVCVRTLYRWRAEHKAFARAFAAGKEQADNRVERAFYQRACGYEYDDVRIFHPAGATKPVIVPVVVHVPANVTAARQWLACRRPQLWGRKRREPEEQPDLAERLRAAQEQIAARQREKDALQAERLTKAVAAALARHGIHE